MRSGGQVVFVRHGESVWNAQKLFTGWRDVALSAAGRHEAVQCGQKLKKQNLVFTRVYTSILLRAIQTLHILLEQLDQHWLGAQKNWRLNERHYGALQGLNKEAVAQQHGAAQVFKWRRHFDAALPQLERNDSTHPLQQGVYQQLSQQDAQLQKYITGPMGESLADCTKRVWPFWQKHIEPDLQQGHCILVVAHGNSLRALVKKIEGIADDKIHELNIDTAKAFGYDSRLKALAFV